MKYLKSLNPDDYVALCVACHRSVHWLKENQGFEWEDIEKHLKRVKQSPLQLKQTFEIESKRSVGKSVSKENIKKLRQSIFGNKCSFCGTDSKERRLAIHRKDGRPHRTSVLWSAGNLRPLEKDEWTALCQKCHRYVHWAEEKLGLSWKDFKKREHEH